MINNRWKRLKLGKHISPSPAFQSESSFYNWMPQSRLFCHQYFPTWWSYIADHQYFRYIHSLQCIDVTDEKPHPFKVLEKQYKVPGYLHLHHHHFNHSNCWKNNTRCLVHPVKEEVGIGASIMVWEGLLSMCNGKKSKLFKIKKKPVNLREEVKIGVDSMVVGGGVVGLRNL